MYIYTKHARIFKSFNIRKRAHISNINLQVECAPLRCCARPRPADRTGGAAKIKKKERTINKTFKKQSKTLTSKIDSLTKYKS